MKLKSVEKRKREADDIVRHLFSVFFGYEARTTKPIAAEIIKAAPYMRNGRLVDVKVRHIGAGVYGVKLVPASPEGGFMSKGFIQVSTASGEGTPLSEALEEAGAISKADLAAVLDDLVDELHHTAATAVTSFERNTAKIVARHVVKVRTRRFGKRGE